MNRRKFFVIILVIVLIIFIVSFFLVGDFFYKIALKRGTSILEKNSTEEEKQAYMQEIGEKTKWLMQNAKEVYIDSEDGLKLHGYEIENRNVSHAWVITIHGYTGNGIEMVSYAKKFYEMGYNILIVDLRAHGQSEGNSLGMGWKDRKDIIQWINRIIENEADSQIILHGVSMGAATVMMTTGENLPENVVGAIEDCGYTSVWEEFSGRLHDIFHLPDFPALYAANLLCKIRDGYSFKEASSVEQLKKSKTPTLFIHGEEDKFVPFAMLDILYNAASCEKEKLIVENAAHAQAAYVNPELYWKTVESFCKSKIR